MMDVDDGSSRQQINKHAGDEEDGEEGELEHTPVSSWPVYGTTAATTRKAIATSPMMAVAVTAKASPMTKFLNVRRWWRMSSSAVDFQAPVTKPAP